jgi:hypothetical protein
MAIDAYDTLGDPVSTDAADADVQWLGVFSD